MFCVGIYNQGVSAPCLSLQASAGFVSVQSHACRIVSYVCPKSFYVKGNKTAFKGFIVVQIFTTICRPFSSY